MRDLPFSMIAPLAFVGTGSFTVCATTSRKSTDPRKRRLKLASKALRRWQRKTGTPPDEMPTDLNLRSSKAADRLGLINLITRAGGYGSVSSHLDLIARQQPRRTARQAELHRLADLLIDSCHAAGQPDPAEYFPDRAEIRRLDPFLMNRIAAFPGRRGYLELRAYILDEAPPPPPHWARRDEDSEESGAISDSDQSEAPPGVSPLTDISQIVALLGPFQPLPGVLPKLQELPKQLSAAIGRQGGARVFASRAGLVRATERLNIQRFAKLVRALSNLTPFEDCDEEGYVSAIRTQSENRPLFPDRVDVREAKMSLLVSKFGGRRCLASRLGYAKIDGIDGVDMGRFSPRLAADLLDFAVAELVPAYAGAVGIPSIEYMREQGREDLAKCVELFGGENDVGRRIGLVPPGPAEDHFLRRQFRSNPDVLNE